MSWVAVAVGVGGVASAYMSSKSADKASDAATEASSISAGAQSEALDYLKEREEIPQALRENALRTLGGLYGVYPMLPSSGAPPVDTGSPDIFNPTTGAMEGMTGFGGGEETGTPSQKVYMGKSINPAIQNRVGSYLNRYYMSGGNSAGGPKNPSGWLGWKETSPGTYFNKNSNTYWSKDKGYWYIPEGAKGTSTPGAATPGTPGFVTPGSTTSGDPGDEDYMGFGPVLGQNEIIQRSINSPLYKNIMGGKEAGEESIMRNAAATGGLRSGDVSSNMYDYNVQLENKALLESYNQQIMGLQGLAGLPSNANTIASGMAGIGETQAQGVTASAQAQQVGTQQSIDNMLAMGQLGISAYDTAMFSDRRLKTNIKKLGKIKGFNFYSFDWNSVANKLGLKGSTYGCMADEIFKIMPEAVILKDLFMMVNYSKIGVL